MEKKETEVSFFVEILKNLFFSNTHSNNAY
jgi:hypothetical protein